MDRRVALLGVLGLHLAAAVIHGATHGLVPVRQPVWQNGLVLVTTFIGPIIGAALAWRDHPWGLPVFAVSMAGALLLGGSLHFFFENPDHVQQVPTDPWRVPFQVSAAAVLLTPALGLVAAGYLWRD